MARQDDRGTVSWYGTDRQGTVRQIFDNSGGETHSAEYDAFGLVLRGTLLDRYGFHGREHDSLTGLRHHRAREFNGQFWMSEDPIGFAAGDANQYRFVGNGPGNGTDPSGMDDIPSHWQPGFENAEKKANDVVKDLEKARQIENTDKAIANIINSSDKYTQEQKDLIISIVLRLVEASRFRWDKITGFFGNCVEWTDVYMKLTIDLRKELEKSGLADHIKVDLMFWQNTRLVLDLIGAGHAAVRIALSDGTTFYLDDGCLGGADHVFQKREVPRHLHPITQRPEFPSSEHKKAAEAALLGPAAFMPRKDRFFPDALPLPPHHRPRSPLPLVP